MKDSILILCTCLVVSLSIVFLFLFHNLKWEHNCANSEIPFCYTDWICEINTDLLENKSGYTDKETKCDNLIGETNGTYNPHLCYMNVMTKGSDNYIKTRCYNENPTDCNCSDPTPDGFTINPNRDSALDQKRGDNVQLYSQLPEDYKYKSMPAGSTDNDYPSTLRYCNGTTYNKTKLF